MGKNSNSTIEINGKRYDAITGSFLGSVTGAPAAPVRSVDGFRQSSSPKLTLVPQKSEPQRAPAQHIKAHTPIPSQTLMRAAVKKPTIAAASTIKAQTRTDVLARTPQQTLAPKVSYNSIDQVRLKKATRMVQNPAVSHYGSAGDVTASPISYAAKNTQSLQKTIESFIAPQPARATNVPNMPVAEARDYSKQPDIFEQALARATSHEQTFDDSKTSKKRVRIGFIATGIMSLLLLIGVYSYFNVPQLSMRLASTRAGFHAKLPTTSPVGYSFGNLSYGPGNVTISYKSDDSHKFDITQRASQWDSQALLTNFVGSANKAYQTYERAGRTIYFFGNNTATWVDNGVWYTVNGNNSLNKNQLLDLASSI